MSILTCHPGLSAFAVVAALMTATPSIAETLRKDDMLRGVTMSQAQCAAIPQAVWVNVYGRDFCVRYYMSSVGGEGKHPVVFLQGDQFGPLDGKAFQWKDPSGTKDVDTADLTSFADSFSKMAKTTAIYLARIGVDGSSGDHKSRKTILELQLMNAALDAIKQRYDFEGFHIAGQSGGSQLLGGLIGLRQDIGCAVAGSGQFTTNNRPALFGALFHAAENGDPGRSYFDAAKFIPSVVHRKSLRLMVVTDPSDKQVPAKMQTAYAQKFHNAGRSIAQFNVEATDDKHHGVVQYTRLAIAGCALGKPDTDIERAIQTLVKRNREINAQKEREAKAKTRLSVSAL
jgi:hypothetical protein